MTDYEKQAAAIRAQIEALAPLSEDGPATAITLARFMGVRAQERFTKLLHPGLEMATEQHQIAAMGAEFAAAHALLALAKAAPGLADVCADQIWGAICDGGGIGEWLWEDLGGERAERAAELAGQMAGVQAAQAAVPSAAETALTLAKAALARLALNDEMAGMGQRDGDPEAIARCKYAAGALESIREAEAL